MPDDKALPEEGRTAAIAEYITVCLMGMMFLPILVFILLLFGKCGEFRWQLPVILSASVPFFSLVLLRGHSAAVKATALLAAAFMLATALAAANLFYDTSWDGRAYHADAILQLLGGNNPLYEAMHGFDDLWTNSYPKATWYFSALVTHLTGYYKLGKCYNLLLIYAAGAYVFAFLKRHGIRTGNALLAAVAAGANPIAISQLHCFYVDGALASLLTLALFSALSILKNTRTADWIVFFCTSCLLINIKFTGAAYLAIIYCLCSGILLARWYQSRSPEDFAQGRQLACVMVLAGLIGGIMMGFNPYITNFLVHKNIFYPLMGKGSIDIIAAQNPKSFNTERPGIAVELLQSIFGRTANVYDQGGTEEPQWKFPFAVDEKEIAWFFASDVRIGGWGVLFSGALVSALILYGLSGAWRDREMLAAIFFVLVSALINPGSWWARYAPQVALLPLVMATPSLSSQERWQRISAKFVLVILLLNAALILPPNTQYYARTTRQLQEQIDSIIKACGRGTYEISDTNGYHFDQFLMDNGIRIIHPAQDIRKTRDSKDLLPLQDVVLYKEGCIRH